MSMAGCDTAHPYHHHHNTLYHSLSLAFGNLYSIDMVFYYLILEIIVIYENGYIPTPLDLF